MTTMLVIFDTECTGAEDTDRICQLSSVIHVEGTAEAFSFNELCNPGIPIPAEVTEIHGITNEMVSGARSPAEVVDEWWRDLYELACGLPEGSQVLFCGHNVQFDIRKVAAFRAAFPIRNILDTLLLSRRAFPHAANHTLSNVHSCYIREPSPQAKKAHDALSDCWMVYDIVQQLIKDMQLGYWGLYGSTLTPVKLHKMPFGKHKDKAFSDIDKSYIEYMLRQDGLDIDLRYTMEVELESRPNVLLDVMPFGKHRGEKISDLPQSYVVWAVSNLTLSSDLEYSFREHFPGVFCD